MLQRDPNYDDNNNSNISKFILKNSLISKKNNASVNMMMLIQSSEDFTVYYSGHDTKKTNGVAFIVRKFKPVD